MATVISTTDPDILHELVFPFDADLDADGARALLRIRFEREAWRKPGRAAAGIDGSGPVPAIAI
jgi:hypothetical protein